MAAKYSDDVETVSDCDLREESVFERELQQCKCEECVLEFQYSKEQEQKRKANLIWGKNKKKKRATFNYIERQNISNSCVGVEKFLVNSKLNPECSFESIIDEGLRKLKIDPNDDDQCIELVFEHLDEKVLDSSKKKDNTFFRNLETLDLFESIESYKRGLELVATSHRLQDLHPIKILPSFCPFLCRCVDCLEAENELYQMEPYSPPPQKESILLRYKILQSDREDRLIRKRKIRLQNAKKRQRLANKSKK